jgi:hypothetical protein
MALMRAGAEARIEGQWGSATPRAITTDEEIQALNLAAHLELCFSLFIVAKPGVLHA